MSEHEYADGPIPENIGVANPYALADLVAGQAIPWNKIEDKQAVLSEILETPYDELFDPVHRSPLYAGLELTGDMNLKRVALRPQEVGLPTGHADDEILDAFQVDPDISSLKTFKDLNQYLKTRKLEELKIQKPEIIRPGTLRMEIQLTNIPDHQIAFPAKGAKMQQLVAATSKVGDGNWQPYGVAWIDPGDFFKEASEFFDPVQGAVGDCYLIAALSSIAWATPYVISQRTRAIQQSNQSFVDMIEFFPSPNSAAKQIEVSEAMPLSSGSHGFLYCRSSEAGEIWPAVYEKAYAKWKTGTATDYPNITAIAGGDPVRATSELNNWKRYYYGTSSQSADNLWSLVRGNSRSYRTFNPMVAWTYSSGENSPDKVRYADANLVANHAYSILGWAYRNNTKYIVLRNPWGQKEANIDTMPGTWWAYDVSWWRPIQMANPDGVFALKASTFKSYFAGMGVTKP